MNEEVKIKLGYKMDSGEEVFIPLGHTMVTGITNLTGKTTALEGLIFRSKRRAVVFRTKIGEKSFITGHKILPYYKDDQNWKTMITLVESVMPSKIGRQERYKIIGLLNQDTNNGLFEFAKKIDDKLDGKLSAFERDIFTGLQAYFKELVEKMQTIKFSKTLELSDGINIVDLEEFAEDEQLQSLIIKSVITEVLNKWKDTIVVIPEAWKFLPQGKGNVCKAAVTSFVKQGATNGNFLWIDSQDITSVDKSPLKQVSVWIMGYQSEANEVKHVLSQVPVPKSKRPSDDEIMSLNKGIFFFGSVKGVVKVFVQAFWVSDSDAVDVALGRKTIRDLPQPPGEEKPIGTTSPVINQKEEFSSTEDLKKHLEMPEQLQVILDDLKLIWQGNKEVDSQIMDIYKRLKELENNKTGLTESGKQKIIDEILSKMPKSNGNNVVYTISPIEKIKKDFLEDAKNQIMKNVSELDEKSKKMLKYIESRGAGVSVNEICTKCFLMNSGGGTQAKSVNEWGKALTDKQLAKKHVNGKFMPMLKDRIIELSQVHGATDQEMDNLYNHIISEMLGTTTS